MIDIQMSIFISILLGVGFGLPISMVVLYYIQKALGIEV